MSITRNRFVQVGNRAFNLANVLWVQFRFDKHDQPEVWLHFSEQDYGAEVLRGTDAKAFRKWWGCHADVYVIDAVPHSPLGE